MYANSNRKTEAWVDRRQLLVPLGEQALHDGGLKRCLVQREFGHGIWVCEGRGTPADARAERPRKPACQGNYRR